MDNYLIEADEIAALKRVRRLTYDDLNKVEELVLPHLEDLKLRGVNTEVYLNPVQSYLTNDNINKFLVGYFDPSGILNSMMSLYAWKFMPFATLGFMFVRKSDFLFNSKKNGLNYCLHSCLEAGESMGIKSFYSLQRANSLKHKQKTWRKHDTSITRKYYSVPEMYIDAGAQPDYFSVWDMMDKQVWPYRTILWLTRKKPQYETVINWGED